MDYLVALPAQLQQHMRSLRKARGMTQAQLAQLLGVGQSRVADIEANPGAVSVDQLLQILGVLKAQVLIRDTADVAPEATAGLGSTPAGRHARNVSTPKGSVSTRRRNNPPQGQW